MYGESSSAIGTRSRTRTSRLPRNSDELAGRDVDGVASLARFGSVGPVNLVAEHVSSVPGPGRRGASLSRLVCSSVQALSPQNRILGVLGAVEAGFALWYFTSGHWVNGSFLAIAVAFLVAVYIRRERKVKGKGGGRRY